MRLVGWFQVVAGAAMLVMWAVLIATGQVPELAEGRLDIRFHLAAEGLTALVLLAAGWLLLQRRAEPARLLSATALGMLLYTSLNAPGYYAELGEWGTVGAFGVLTGAVVAVLLTLLGRRGPGTSSRRSRAGVLVQPRRLVAARR